MRITDQFRKGTLGFIDNSTVTCITRDQGVQQDSGRTAKNVLVILDNGSTAKSQENIYEKV